jgi:hypothetical protein
MINPTTFMLNATGGSRFSGVIPFYSGGMAVLYDSGDRPDLASLIAPDLAQLEQLYTTPSNFVSANFYRGLSGWLGSIIADDQHPDGLVADATGVPPTVPGGSTGTLTTPTSSTGTLTTPTIEIRSQPTSHATTTGQVHVKALGADVNIVVSDLSTGTNVRAQLMIKLGAKGKETAISQARGTAGATHRVSLKLVSRKLAHVTRMFLVRVTLNQEGRVTSVITRSLHLHR